jgi:hypothetical protein
MGIDVVNPQEDRTFGITCFSQPRQRGVGGARRTAFPDLARGLLLVHEVVVVIESAGQTDRLFGEHDARDECGRLIALRQSVGQHLDLVWDELVEQAHPVVLRKASSEEAHDARGGARGGAVRPRVDAAHREEGVEIRRGVAVVTVGPEMIGPQRVDTQEHEIRRLASDAAGSTAGKRHEQRRNEREDRRGIRRAGPIHVAA